MYSSAAERRTAAGLRECISATENPKTALDVCPVYKGCRVACDATLRLLIECPTTAATTTIHASLCTNIGDQLSRSATSVTANLAEGDGRASSLQRIAFAKIARGSLLESIDHVRTLSHLDEACGSVEWTESRKRCIQQWSESLAALDHWLAALAKTTLDARS